MGCGDWIGDAELSEFVDSGFGFHAGEEELR
jgi:hypothetical protein